MYWSDQVSWYNNANFKFQVNPASWLLIKRIESWTLTLTEVVLFNILQLSYCPKVTVVTFSSIRFVLTFFVIYSLQKIHFVLTFMWYTLYRKYILYWPLCNIFFHTLLYNTMYKLNQMCNNIPSCMINPNPIYSWHICYTQYILGTKYLFRSRWFYNSLCATVYLVVVDQIGKPLYIREVSLHVLNKKICNRPSRTCLFSMCNFCFAI